MLVYWLVLGFVVCFFLLLLLLGVVACGFFCGLGFFTCLILLGDFCGVFVVVVGSFAGESC